MYQLTRLELEHLYTVLTAVRDEDTDLFMEEIEQAIEIVQEVLRSDTRNTGDPND